MGLVDESKAIEIRLGHLQGRVDDVWSPEDEEWLDGISICDRLHDFVGKELVLVDAALLVILRTTWCIVLPERWLICGPQVNDLMLLVLRVDAMAGGIFPIVIRMVEVMQ